MGKPKIKITKKMVKRGYNSQIPVWTVKIQSTIQDKETTQSTVQNENFGSQETLKAFLKGVEAAFGCCGIFIDLPEIP